jgi:hypothetical protein
VAIKWKTNGCDLRDFLYLIYHDFAKIYSPPKILQKYTSAVRDITPWLAAVGAARSGPLAWPRRGAVRRGIRGLAPRATASCPSATGHDGSRPASVVGAGHGVMP